MTAIVICGNKHCNYPAAGDSAYCCLTCQNASLTGSWEYSFHSSMCKRGGETRLLYHSYGKDHFHRNLLIGVGVAIVIVILLFGLSISLGAK